MKAFQKSSDTLIIENRLRETTPGEVITYDELKSLVGRGVQAGSPCYGNLRTALKTLEEEHIVFLVVRGDGLKRATDTETAESADHYRQSVSRTNKRMVKRILAVKDFEALPAETKTKTLALQTSAGLIDLVTSAKGTKKIEKAIENAALPIGKTLELFK